MLSCKGLHVRYGSIPVLRDVSLEVHPNELVVLLGPNGAGKTTTLRTITGLVRPQRGDVTFNGRSLVGMDPADIVALGIALVPQGRMIFQTLSVRENLLLGAYLVRDRAAIEQRLEAVLGIFPALRARLHQVGGTLSGGEQQMLAIGRALMSEPALLILDEPSTGLAPLMVESIFASLAALHRQGTMILLVEQNAHVALDVGTRGYVLESGTIVAAGSASALSADARLVEAYLG